MSPLESPFEASLLDLATRLADGCGEIVAVVSPAGVTTVLNPRVVAGVLGVELQTPTVAELAELVLPEDRSSVAHRWSVLVTQPGGRDTMRFRARHRSGRTVLLEATAVRHHEGPTLRAVVVHVREIAGTDMSIVDEVTDPGSYDLRTEAEFMRALREAVWLKFEKVWQSSRFAMSATKDRRYDFALLLVELDRFKFLVGSHGPDLADRMAREVSERLQTLLSRSDVLGYFGGGEFAILLRGVGDETEALRFADRVHDVVGEELHIDGHVVASSAIIGIATSDRRYERPEQIMSDAAAALNRARREQRKRRRAAFETHIRLEDQQYITVLTEMHSALRLEQFRLVYQPIVALSDGTLRGFEALVRWQHPTRGNVMPGEFIPVAEQTGFINDLGKWVLREACRQTAAWRAAYPGVDGLSVSVNLSAAQVGEELLPLVEGILAETKLEPQRLCLEVTESAVLKNAELASRVLSMLRLYGIKLALDDFGTGYASFSYLHQLPFDTLKIDRSFIMRLTTGDPEDAGEADIVSAMIHLAHALKLEVVAEGVETQDQAELLQQLLCDRGQGFHLSRPLAVDAAEQLLASDPRW